MRYIIRGEKTPEGVGGGGVIVYYLPLFVTVFFTDLVGHSEGHIMIMRKAKDGCEGRKKRFLFIY